MVSWFIRILIVAISAIAGYAVGLSAGHPLEGGVFGLVFGVLTNLAEGFFRTLKTGYFIGGLIGLGGGIAFGHLLTFPMRHLLSPYYGVATFIADAFCGYCGLLVGLARGRSLTVESLIRIVKGQALEENLKVLDTSVIIDGRIADVCETGFLEGVFIVPQFILQELQHVADSSDSMRRAKGRRGLDILHRIQKMSHVTVRIVEEDFSKIREVDAKLVALARYMNAKIITNDFNLNKVAELQGVAVLNINELANALKPVVLPGELLRVFVLKEGKEANQGVAYLDDGTMVVIENGKRLIGRTVDASVTSVLQTTAGRMIFARPVEGEK